MKKSLKLFAATLALAICASTAAITASAEKIEFTDVDKTDYFYPAVQWGLDAGITQGVGDNLFAPDGEVTRAQVVTFLWNMAGKPASSATEIFADVEAGSWYETAVAWAVENEITAGTGDNMFSPDAVCDRAMCITFLYRLMDSPLDGIDFTTPAELNEEMNMEDMMLEEFGDAMTKQLVVMVREADMFSDVPQDSYYELPVIWAVLNGIITNDNTGTLEEGVLFRSDDPCIRKEMISFLYQTKLVNDLKNAPAEVYFDEYSVPIPQEYFDRLYFYYYGGGIDEETGEELLLIVSEKASIEATEAMGEEETEGIGELFRIVKISEDKLHELLCSDMSGIQAFAKDEEGGYYLFCTPTDVRYVRETNEKMNEDIAGWTELNEWARGELINEILQKNSSLTPVNFTNTMLDMYLARIAYAKDVKYTISSTAYSPLEPGNFDGTKYAEYLLCGISERVDDAESPAGGYVSLNFTDEGVRYDFFNADQNLVRESRGNHTTFYKRVLPGSVTNTEAMEDWYFALAEQKGK